jgi:hypothetical protein
MIHGFGKVLEQAETRQRHSWHCRVFLDVSLVYAGQGR